MWVILSILFAIIYTEIVGYFLHRLMHSETFTSLSRPHMIHHLEHYAPRTSMRTANYKSSTSHRANIGGIGFEWIIPIGIILIPTIVSAVYFDISWVYQVIFYVTGIAWGVLGFDYVHNGMHSKNFWALKIPVLNRWFKNKRRLHDIHHNVVDSEGRMNKNYGILFFFMDRIFRTYSKKLGRVCEEDILKAKQKYSFIKKV